MLRTISLLPRRCLVTTAEGSQSSDNKSLLSRPSSNSSPICPVHHLLHHPRPQHMPLVDPPQTPASSEYYPLRSRASSALTIAFSGLELTPIPTLLASSHHCSYRDSSKISRVTPFSPQSRDRTGSLGFSMGCAKQIQSRVTALPASFLRICSGSEVERSYSIQDRSPAC